MLHKHLPDTSSHWGNHPPQFRYTLIDWGGVTAARITGLESNASNISALYVPSTITTEDGVQYPVKSVGENAFSGNPWLVAIYFGEGIEEIRLNACQGCNALTEISLPSTLKVYYGGLERCHNVTSLVFNEGLEELRASWCYGCNGLVGVIKIPSTVKIIESTTLTSTQVTAFEVDSANDTFKSEDGVIFTKDGSELVKAPSSSEWGAKFGDTGYSVPTTVTKIRWNAFGKTMGLKRLTINEGCVYAGDGVWCSDLNELNIPSTLQDNPVATYAPMPRLTTINVAESNPTMKSIDGVVFSKDSTTLIQCPGGLDKDYTVPSGTVTLGKACLAMCVLKSLTLNEGLRTIQNSALRNTNTAYNTEHLGPLVIPASLETIEDGGLFESRFDKFEVAAGNNCFSTDGVGNVLYNADKTKAIVYTAYRGKTGDVVTLPASVREIGYGLSYAHNGNIRVLDLSKTGIEYFTSYMWYDVSRNGVTDVKELIFPTAQLSIATRCIELHNISTFEVPANVYYISPNAIILPYVTRITFHNRGMFTTINNVTNNSIFGAINRSCVISGYKGSSAEDIANAYTLRFEPLD